MLKHLFLLIFLSVIFNNQSMAEPWISNRYAQNCAGCHAPGRLNLPPKGRRCTLSCQGCHVNPNGGGIRNQYGLWNQKRFLRSVKSKTLNSMNLPAVHTKQSYMGAKRLGNGTFKKGQLTEIENTDYNEYQYSNKVYKDWHEEAKDFNHFLSRVPEGDPYRLERNTLPTVSGDFRYIYAQNEGENVPETQKTLSFGMSFDLGVRVRPVREKFSFVLESRFLNRNVVYKDLDDTGSRAKLRTAYALFDDLAYNSYVMFGMYLPMFGNYTPDHTRLASEITGLNQYTTLKGLGFGTAPNVPFANFNIIFPTTNGFQASEGFSKDEGFVANVGLRGVTKSLSTKLSYWDTKNKELGYEKKMVAWTGGMMLGRTIGNAEVVYFDILDNSGDNAGVVSTVEFKYRLWREIYAMLNYAQSNTSNTKKEGEANESMVGFKSFLLPGTELELSYINRYSKTISGTNSTTSKVDTVQLQAHMFF